MPLESGKSKVAFEHNVKAELSAGKPKSQALAIAYSKQRENDMSMSETRRMKKDTIIRERMKAKQDMHSSKMGSSN